MKIPPKKRQEWTCRPEEATWCEGITGICIRSVDLYDFMREHEMNTLDALDAMLRNTTLTTAKTHSPIDT